MKRAVQGFTSARNMIKAIIFDLDSCLSPADEPGQQLFAPAFEAISNANRGSHSPAVLQQAYADMWRLPYDFVAEKYQFTPEMRAAGWGILARVKVTTPMRGYGDLAVLENLPGLKFIVTSGFRRLQESKIQALGIAPLFTAVYIDAIDEPGHRGKQCVFEEILREYKLRPGDVLIVGDNHDSELAAGLRLRIRTVQTLRPGVPRSPSASCHIRELPELPRIITLLTVGADQRE